MKSALYALAIVVCTVTVPVATMAVAVLLLMARLLRARRRAWNPKRTQFDASAHSFPTQIERLAAHLAAW